MKKQKAAFLDRDGTLIVEREYLDHPGKMRLIKNSKQALAILKKAGFLCFLVSNQSGVGRGFFTREDVEKVHAALEQRLLKNNLKLDGIYYCPHHPDDHCRCRKPEVGLVKQACQQFQVDLKKSVVIGDRESDLELGKRIGSQTILVLTGYGKLAQKSLRIKPDYIAPNLFEAARWIINKK